MHTLWTGLHPRVTHLCINMPMMFGPLALVALFSCLRGWTDRNIQKAGDGMGAKESRVSGGLGEGGEGMAEVRRCVGACAVVGVGILSCAPHQVCVCMRVYACECGRKHAPSSPGGSASLKLPAPECLCASTSFLFSSPNFGSNECLPRTGVF